MIGLSTSSPASRLLGLIVAGPNRRTAQAYRSDLEDFRAYLGMSELSTAVTNLLDMNQVDANLLVHEYRDAMAKRGLSSATINRRLSCLRAMVRQARGLGLVNWTLDVENLRSEPYRDTRGPDRSGVEKMLSFLRCDLSPKAKRDRAAVHLLFDLALRREEVVALDVEDLDLENGRIAVLGKGRTQKIQLTVPERTREALAAWCAVRGGDPGPLFTNYDPAGKGNRLTGRSLHRIVLRLAERAGLRRVTPHSLRHAAITEALNLTNGDVRAVQRFSRHRDLRVLNIYDDCREDLAGQIASLVAAGGCSPLPPRLSRLRPSGGAGPVGGSPVAAVERLAG